MSKVQQIEQKLEQFSAKQRAQIVRTWRRIMIPKLFALAKELNPFEGKAKPSQKSIFGVSSVVPKTTEGVISIWGVHPNAAADPVKYPSLPREGFRKLPKKVLVKFHKIGIYRYIGKAQEHWSTFPYAVYNRTPLKDYFMLRGNVYGMKLDTLEPVPVYSARSVPELVSVYDGLEDIIIESFEEAMQKP